MKSKLSQILSQKSYLITEISEEELQSLYPNEEIDETYEFPSEYTLIAEHTETNYSALIEVNNQEYLYVCNASPYRIFKLEEQ